MTDLIRKLADYAATEQTRALPALARHHARRAIIDWFACMLPGAAQKPATLLMSALAGELNGHGAIVYGNPNRAPLRTAALINAASSHIIEFDDIFRDGLYHPGSPVVAAALAAAQARNEDGEILLRAVVAGYEVSTRIATALQPAHYKYWHTTATIGTIGAAVATATVLRLSADQIVHAIANSVTFAAGLQKAYASETMTKPLHAGNAAEAGALAALAAEAGVTGPRDILDGPRGFGEAMSDGGNWAKATDRLGDHYNITATTIKNHGCCGHSHAPVDAVIALQQGHGLTPDNVSRIEVGTYRTACEITDRQGVTSAMEARFSTPFTVATALVHHSVRLAAFTPERLRDRTVQDVMTRVVMSVDPECEALFPRRAARVKITTTDGRVLEWFQPTRKGDPDAPLSDQELVNKYTELTTPAIGADSSDTLLRDLWRVDTMNAAEIANLGAAASAHATSGPDRPA